MTKLFVWIQGLKGPEAQLWDELKENGGKKVKYLACYSVPDEAKLDDLMRLYPFEAKE